MGQADPKGGGPGFPWTAGAMQTMEKGEKAMRPWWLRASRDQAQKTGMAVVLVSLLWVYLGHRTRMLPLAIMLLLLTMLLPRVFVPLAVTLFAVSRILGEVASRVVLTLVFFLLVTPVGLLRRWAGKDSMQHSRWKRGRDSVLVARRGVIRPDDLDHPY